MVIWHIANHIKEWKSWNIDDWAFFVLFSGIVLMVVVVLIRQSFEMTDAVSLVLGLLALWVLVRITFPWLVWTWHSEIGKVAIAFYSIVVVAFARVVTDYEIVTTTSAPASLFPRAQDVLTLLFSVREWLVLGLSVLALSAIVSQIALVVLTIGKRFWVKSAKERVVLAFKVLVSGAVVLNMGALVEDKMLRMEYSIFEHAIVLSSFVENKAIPFHLMPPGFGPRPAGYPEALHHCPLLPKEAYVAFVTGDNVKDDEVMVALPSKGTRNAFTFVWAKCGAANRTKDEER